MEPELDDPYHGVGGAYVIDKKTGKRVPVQDAPPPATPDEPLSDAPTELTE